MRCDPVICSSLQCQPNGNVLIVVLLIGYCSTFLCGTNRAGELCDAMLMLLVSYVAVLVAEMLFGCCFEGYRINDRGGGLWE